LKATRGGGKEGHGPAPSQFEARKVDGGSGGHEQDRSNAGIIAFKDDLPSVRVLVLDASRSSRHLGTPLAGHPAGTCDRHRNSGRQRDVGMIVSLLPIDGDEAINSRVSLSKWSNEWWDVKIYVFLLMIVVEIESLCVTADHRRGAGSC
jgi:hypothetical protein